MDYQHYGLCSSKLGTAAPANVPHSRGTAGNPDRRVAASPPRRVERSTPYVDVGERSSLPHHLRRIVHLHTRPRIQRLPRRRRIEQPCILLPHLIPIVIPRIREAI